MLDLLIIIFIVLLAWFIFQPDWLPKPQKNGVFQKFNQQIDRLKQKSLEWIKPGKPVNKKGNDLGNKFKGWISQDDLMTKAGFSQTQKKELADFQTWFRSIPDNESKTFVLELSSFCKKQGVELGWLIEDDTNLKNQTVLSHLVLFFGLAVLERDKVHPDAVLRTWEKDPLGSENRSFGNSLFIHLVDAKIISLPSSLWMAPEKERLAQMVGLIKTVIEKDRETVIHYASLALKPEPASAPSGAQATIQVEK